MFKDTMEYQRLIKRTDSNGCGGDCENCNCWGSCSIARPIPDYYDGIEPDYIIPAPEEFYPEDPDEYAPDGNDED